MIIDESVLLKKLDSVYIDDNIFKVTPAKDNGYTILYKTGESSVYINSKYNPEKSGRQFAASVFADKAQAIFGLGLGYHIKPLADMLGNNKHTLYVFECSLQIVKIAFEKTDIFSVLQRDNVVFLCTDNLAELAAHMDNTLNSIGGDLIIYEPSLNTIPQSMEKLRDILYEYKAAVGMRLQHKIMMDNNSKINIAAGYRNGVKVFYDTFKNVPAIVVAAGASLDLNVSELLDVRDKALIISVTRAAKTLEAALVSPDFYVASDAGAWLNAHLNFDTMTCPLFLLSTADSNASSYKGEKLIIFEKNSAFGEDKNFFVEAGGSVATIAISLCAVMGANPIVLVGQDLCYSFESSHSGGGGVKVTIPKGGKRVKANDGNEYYTSGSLYIFLKWIERFIARNKCIKFYNATARGAVIEGAANINLIEFFKHYPIIRDKITDVKTQKSVKIL